MTFRLTKEAYQKLIDEDLQWLGLQPRTLEREHIGEIVKQSVVHEYDVKEAARVAIGEAMEMASCHGPRCAEHDKIADGVAVKCRECVADDAYARAFMRLQQVLR